MLLRCNLGMGYAAHYADAAEDATTNCKGRPGGCHAIPRILSSSDQNLAAERPALMAYVVLRQLASSPGEPETCLRMAESIRKQTPQNPCRTQLDARDRQAFRISPERRHAPRDFD
ncbi:hypothetical protein DCS_02864 [Drechmeria coniospora]|uniref:Uncharacterized protein n=1 Tax=Drechmeria coniospora TaxID=98403 RepID=A0A151GXC4_DRECN|nr:hypothetical protein DCS_02864 [Drechmeria coniospora]KYK61721.1 hypothetical protein DCS_02864 [Drechmeria coniospora]